MIMICESKYKKVLFLSDEGPTLETLDYTIRIGSTPTFLYFDLYLYSAYAAHYVYDMYLALKKLHYSVKDIISFLFLKHEWYEIIADLTLVIMEDSAHRRKQVQEITHVVALLDGKDLRVLVILQMILQIILNIIFWYLHSLSGDESKV